MRIVLAVAMSLVVLACGRDRAPRSEPARAVAADAAPAANPVQHEMRLLHTAMQVTLSGIAYGDVRAAPAAFEEVDRAKRATEAALEGGGYVLARNPDRLARFRELDEAFHAEVAAVAAAAARNDVPATAEAFGAAMRSCQGCHGEFRK